MYNKMQCTKICQKIDFSFSDPYFIYNLDFRQRYKSKMYLDYVNARDSGNPMIKSFSPNSFHCSIYGNI